MSIENLTILYVGDPQRGRDLLAAAEAQGGYVFLPSETMEALAMYITYLPDITVIDLESDPAVAREVYRHLNSVDADPLVLLSDGMLPEGVGESARALSRALSAEELLAVIVETVHRAFETAL